VLPVLALPEGALVQPVHVDDVVRDILALVAPRSPELPLVASRTIAFVGPAPLTLRHCLAELRQALGLAPPAVVLELPGRLCLALACVAGRLPASFVDRDAVSMLLMNLSVALVWIWTGLVSLGLYPVAGSLRLLADFGLHGALAKLALYSAAVLDLGLWGC